MDEYSELCILTQNVDHILNEVSHRFVTANTRFLQQHKENLGVCSLKLGLQ